MKKYNLINNTLGWLMFAVAAVTYLLTIEPTASFWDCPEFIAQGYKVEIGHPPGNPIFILVARFATLFAGGDVLAVSKCVNAMSALQSAATIMLLFWTITHLVRRLLVPRGEEDSITVAQYFAIMGSGVAGALAYTWSDTFWFSAEEAEVYAFSSLCTALVFWLILKWEDRADEPGSDRWLLLIAYIFGVSLGVHLLNLLCIPAIALVFYYRKWEKTNLKGSLLALLVSFIIIALILYGLEPGFVELSQYFDLLFVNTFGLPFNSGVLAYAILLVAVLCWGVYEIYNGSSNLRMKFAFAAGILMSGMLFFGDNLLIPIVLFAGLCTYLLKFCPAVPRRLFANVLLSILVIFIGFSSYALILIRSSANTPLDENSPNNVFALAKYLSREQYGETPLLYGHTAYSDLVYQDRGDGVGRPMIKYGAKQYAEVVKQSADDADRYVVTGRKREYMYSPEQNMVFPRIHSDLHKQQYEDWLGLQGEQVNATSYVDRNGDVLGRESRLKPTVGENLRFFIDYQVNYMYWRYFMWNFAGRQNDLQGLGEVTQGNWISGIPFIDNPRLGDQSLLPDDLGKGNKGHNVFYLLPLLLGILGMLWQAYKGQRGIEQFWVVFFLFFMTGLAIVLYLNQTPNQPRERDYAYAGSFYAYAIWIGMGVAGLWRLMLTAIRRIKKTDTKTLEHRYGLAPAMVAAAIGLAVPLQMVSQTWDDHDRSGRYAAHDFGMNYLSSLAPNAIIFTNGDNDTFPLWYLQEVEGYRTDVRVVNLSYLSTDWYIAQMQRAAYDSKPLLMQASDTTFAYDHRQVSYVYNPDTIAAMPMSTMLTYLYRPDSWDPNINQYTIRYPKTFIPVDAQQAVDAGVISEYEKPMAVEAIPVNVAPMGGLTSSQLMTLDLVNSSITEGKWTRPCYFAMTVPQNYYMGLTPYLRNTGMAYQVTPLQQASATGDVPCATDLMYKNVTEKFRWGGLDTAEPGSLYLDETVRRMVTTVRTALVDLAEDLTAEGEIALTAAQNGQTQYRGMTPQAYADNRFEKARTVLNLMLEKLPFKASPLAVGMGDQLYSALDHLAQASNDSTVAQQAKQLLLDEIMRYAQYVRYYQSLSPSTYGRLNRLDQYVDRTYFPVLLYRYSGIAPEETEGLLNKLQAKGVNVDRAAAMLEQMQAQ